MSDSSDEPCPIAAKVAADVMARARFGLSKYGTNLARTDLNRRDWLQHAMEEAMDLACYLRVLIEREDKAVTKDDAERFVAALRDLCAEHGVMLWSAVESTPIMLSRVEADDLPKISYRAEQTHPLLETFSVRRVLRP